MAENVLVLGNLIELDSSTPIWGVHQRAEGQARSAGASGPNRDDGGSAVTLGKKGCEIWRDAEDWSFRARFPCSVVDVGGEPQNCQ